MNKLSKLKLILTGQRPLIDVWHYNIGNYRYWLYYNFFKGAIRPHIQEQIEWRIQVMNRDCYNNGSCVKCGCTTVQLQMCSKACDGNCYPKMMGKIAWNKFKDNNYGISRTAPGLRQSESR